MHQAEARELDPKRHMDYIRLEQHPTALQIAPVDCPQRHDIQRPAIFRQMRRALPADCVLEMAKAMSDHIHVYSKKRAKCLELKDACKYHDHTDDTEVCPYAPSKKLPVKLPVKVPVPLESSDSESMDDSSDEASDED